MTVVAIMVAAIIMADCLVDYLAEMDVVAEVTAKYFFSSSYFYFYLPTSDAVVVVEDNI